MTNKDRLTEGIIGARKKVPSEEQARQEQTSRFPGGTQAKLEENGYRDWGSAPEPSQQRTKPVIKRTS